ncbi:MULTISPECIES: SDR family NAD(P)-dependent oxidoreductase [Mycobacterium]|uniref:Oxidoreductase n=1 Tax=Mycobacterium syngnathidarum TaxID=1908205 RepID=A0A1S1KIX0_9MYCO|nr:MULTISPECIES: SDR family NAD(P)-dependent oxidoreductase [Mycobacterium]MCG7606561.1 SDR family oxidoreductase [Mycobacterium sp. CnD-18-1]OHU05746.1 oxidoreductase [Mycobacterium syngnathidarum]
MTNPSHTIAGPAELEESLAGKVAIVTGAARGIGLEIARTYAAHGAKVMVSDIDRAAATEAAGQLPDASPYVCDVRSEDSVSDLVDHTLELHGQVDIVVANAGIATVSPLTEMSFEMWRTMMSINLDGVFLTVKHAARAMLAGGAPGSIITMGSVTALCGTPLVGHYGAAKAAVVNLTKTAALELRPHGIRVNSILPGFAETALVSGNKQAYTETLGVDFDAVIAQAQGGYVDVKDVAAVALFLAGDRSSFCTGSGYVVDGGLTASLI